MAFGQHFLRSEKTGLRVTVVACDEWYEILVTVMLVNSNEKKTISHKDHLAIT